MPVLTDVYDTATPAGATGMGPTGDDTIREWKRAFLERYQVEHDVPVAAGSGLSGRHKFPSGNTASRPTDPATGSIYLNTTLHLLDYWTGSAWAQVLKDTQKSQSVVANPTQTLTTSDVIISGSTITAVEAGIYLVFCHVDISFDDVGNNGIGIISLYQNGAVLRNALFYVGTFDGDQTGVGGLEMNAPAQAAILAAGGTLDLRVRKNTGPSTGTIFQGRITILRVI